MRVMPLVARAREAGRLRDDIEASDIPMVVFMIVSGAEYTHGADPELWRRYLAIALDGLRGDSKLPRRALAMPEMAECMSKWK